MYHKRNGNEMSVLPSFASIVMIAVEVQRESTPLLVLAPTVALDACPISTNRIGRTVGGFVRPEEACPSAQPLVESVHATSLLTGRTYSRRRQIKASHAF
jgi:hypothetical protein